MTRDAGDISGGPLDAEDVAAAFGRVLRAARKERGLSQERLAEAVDVDRTYVSMLERGIHQPSLTVLLRMADALGVPAPQLVSDVLGGLRDGSRKG